MKHRLQLWFYLEKALAEQLPIFQQIFKVDDLVHDYENVWEWICSSNENNSLVFNFSRPHDGNGNGEYHKPIMINIESNTKALLNEVKIAEQLKQAFQCEIFAGEIFADCDDNPVIVESRKY